MLHRGNRSGEEQPLCPLCEMEDDTRDNVL